MQAPFTHLIELKMVDGLKHRLFCIDGGYEGKAYRWVNTMLRFSIEKHITPNDDFNQREWIQQAISENFLISNKTKESALEFI